MDEHHSEKPSAKVDDNRLADNAKRDSAPICARKVGLVSFLVAEPLPTLQQGLVVFQSLSSSVNILQNY